MFLKNGSAYSNMGESGSSEILNSANEVIDTSNVIYNVIRLIGAAVLMFEIIVTFISLSLKNRPFESAQAKITLAGIALISIFFIFAEPIFNWLEKTFKSFEGTFGK